MQPVVDEPEAIAVAQSVLRHEHHRRERVVKEVPEVAREPVGNLFQCAKRVRSRGVQPRWV